MLPGRQKRVLVVADPYADGKARSSTLAAVAFGRRLCNQIEAEWYLYAAMSEAVAARSELRQLGARGLFFCPIEAEIHPSAERHATVICQLIGEHSFDFVVAAATSANKDLLPRIAGLLDAAYIGDCTGVEATASGATFLRPMYAGAATAHCRANSSVVMVTARPTEYDLARTDESSCPIVAVDTLYQRVDRTALLDFRATHSDRPSLSDARIVVAGGRPLGTRFFDVLGPLADACGAALGATRALCDTGHVPVEFQVGQSGRYVAPELYFAIGISGSVQHVAGMSRSRTIVAINSDPKAPIFSYADLGLVGDLWQLVPELATAIRQQRSRNTR
jgi:electron transfer flavoprotein alpha subunit